MQMLVLNWTDKRRRAGYWHDPGRSVACTFADSL